MREYFTLHRSVFPSYLTIESGRMDYKWTLLNSHSTLEIAARNLIIVLVNIVCCYLH